MQSTIQTTTTNHTSEEQNNAGSLGFLPLEAFLEICIKLNIQSLLNLRETNKHIRELVDNQVLWKSLFAKHFPHMLEFIPTEENILWFYQFICQARKEYDIHNECSLRDEMFYYLKEGNLKLLEILFNNSKNSVQQIIATSDRHKISFFDWLLKLNNQTLMDYIYQRILAEKYITIRDDSGRYRSALPSLTASQKERIQSLQRGKLLAYAIGLNQGVDELNKLKEFFEYYPSDLHDIPKDLGSMKPIHYAARYGRKDVIKYYLDEDPTLLNKVSKNNKSPLAHAIKAGHEEIVFYLLEQGASLANTCALQLALQNKHYKLAKQILEWAKKTPLIGSNLDTLINTVDQNNLSPLAWAIKAKQKEMAHALIAIGANINSGSGPHHPLSCAIQTGQIDMIETLLTLKSELPENAFHYVIYSFCSLSKFFTYEFPYQMVTQEGIKEINQPDPDLTESLRFEIFKLLCTCFPDRLNDIFNNRGLDTHHVTLLAYAVYHQKKEFVDFLIEQKVSLDGVNAQNPLYIAIYTRNLPITKALIKANCPIANAIVECINKKYIDKEGNLLHKGFFKAKSIHLLLLIHYIQMLQKEIDAQERHSFFSSLNESIAKLNAAKALKLVLIDDADPAILKDHLKVLKKSSTLASICSVFEITLKKGKGKEKVMEVDTDQQRNGQSGPT